MTGDQTQPNQTRTDMSHGTTDRDACTETKTACYLTSRSAPASEWTSHSETDRSDTLQLLGANTPAVLSIPGQKTAAHAAEAG